MIQSVNSLTTKEDEDSVSFYADATLRVRINNSKIVALIDSGSSVNCIKFETMEKAIPNYKAHLKLNDLVFRGANNSSIRCVGRIDVMMHMSDSSLCGYCTCFQRHSARCDIRPTLFDRK